MDEKTLKMLSEMSFHFRQISKLCEDIVKTENQKIKGTKHSHIKDILLDIGPFSNMIGFMYTIEAIEYMLNSKNIYKTGMVSQVYSHIAKTHCVTDTSVERCIRSIMEACFDYGDHEVLNKLKLKTNVNGKITNSQFLFGIYHYCVANGIEN